MKVVDWAEYTLSLSGMLRTTELMGDPWRYRVQVGWRAGPYADWRAVSNWPDVGWDTYYERTNPGSFLSYRTNLTAAEDYVTVYVRVWKKWGVGNQELDVNLDAISLTGPSPYYHDKPYDHDQRPVGGPVGGPVTLAECVEPCAGTGGPVYPVYPVYPVQPVYPAYPEYPVQPGCVAPCAPVQPLPVVRQPVLGDHKQPVLGDRKECLGAVVNFVDITALKIVDRLKSEFVSKVSHELRSPLSTIHEQLATVIGDLVHMVPVQDQHILTRAKEKTKGMISLINDLLDMSRIDEGVICREPRPVSLDELLRSIIDFLGEKAKAKRQSLELILPQTPLPEMRADPIALESIFGNLITNALNYTPEGGRIRLEVDITGVNVRARVIDNGLGIAEKHLDKIFERFYRVKDEKTRYITGTGLGLPIVKGLLDAMGGIIEVQSTPGEGSVFTVLLPVQASSNLKARES